MKKILTAILVITMIVVSLVPVSAAVKTYDEAADGELIYTFDFRGDDVFAPEGVGTATTNFDFTPSEDGSALTIKGTGKVEKSSNFWGGLLKGVYSDIDTTYTLVYKVKANGNVGMNNSIGVGAWIKNRSVKGAKFFNNYGNYNTVDANGGTADRRSSLSNGSTKITKEDGTEYIMWNTIGKYAQDADGFVTVMIEYNGPEKSFSSFVLAEGAGDGTKVEDWVKIETQKMPVSKVADGMGFMIYACYDVIDTTVKDVQLYKGTRIEYPEVTEAPTTDAPTTSKPEAQDTSASDEPEAVVPEETEPAAAEGGCGSTVSFAGVALVGVIGTCTAFVSKKRRK